MTRAMAEDGCRGEALRRRRSLLATCTNPLRRYSALIALASRVAPGPAPEAMDIAIGVRYLPDAHLLKPEAWSRYLDQVMRDWAGDPAAAAGGPEDLTRLAGWLMDDIASELVPLWQQIRVSRPAGAGRLAERLVVEDRQPGWDDPVLLQRIPLH